MQDMKKHKYHLDRLKRMEHPEELEDEINQMILFSLLHVQSCVCVVIQVEELYHIRRAHKKSQKGA